MAFYDHFQFVTGRKRNPANGVMDPTMAQHSSTDYSHYRWPVVKARVKAAGHGQVWKGLRFTVLRPTYNKANIGAPVQPWGAL